MQNCQLPKKTQKLEIDSYFAIRCKSLRWISQCSFSFYCEVWQIFSGFWNGLRRKSPIVHASLQKQGEEYKLQGCWWHSITNFLGRPLLQSIVNGTVKSLKSVVWNAEQQNRPLIIYTTPQHHQTVKLKCSRACCKTSTFHFKKEGNKVGRELEINWFHDSFVNGNFWDLLFISLHFDVQIISFGRFLIIFLVFTYCLFISINPNQC